MSNILLFNKPFQVLTQFTDPEGRATLADYIKLPGFYAAGRLDYDSEGLLILTNDGALQHMLAHPKFKMEKTYWAQVEGEITQEALTLLRKGVLLKDGITRPAKAKQMEAPKVWDRTPPVRERKAIPTSWIELKITEGKNRQVRRMTAAVGFPTLRLIRYAIGSWTIDDLPIGEFRADTIHISQKPKGNASGSANRKGRNKVSKPTGRRANPTR